MHASATEPRDLSGCVEAGDRPAVRAEHLRVQVRLHPTERLPRQDRQPDRYQRPGRGVKETMRRRDAGQPIPDVATGAAQGRNLEVFGEPVDDLAISGHDFGLDRGQVQERFRGDLVHALHKLGQRRGGYEIRTVIQEGLNGRGNPARYTLHDLEHRLTRHIRVLLRAGEGELALDDLPRQHEPAVIAPRGAQMLKGAQRVETGEKGGGQPPPVGVQP